MEAQLSDDALVDDSTNDSANDQLTVPQPVGTLSGACPFAVGLLLFVLLLRCVVVQKATDFR